MTWIYLTDQAAVDATKILAAMLVPSKTHLGRQGVGVLLVNGTILEIDVDSGEDARTTLSIIFDRITKATS